MKKLSIIFSFLLITIFSANLLADCKVTILHFNDFHGYLEKPKKGFGGAARLGGVIEKVFKENDKNGTYTLVLNGGDLISGTPISEHYKGEAEFKFSEAIGTAAMVVGNHEFDYGQERLKELIKNADFAVISANIIDGKKQRLFTDSQAVFPLERGCRVGVLGLTTKTTPTSTRKKNVTGLIFRDPVEQAYGYIDDLVEQSEVRIALTHLGVAEDIRLAKKVPEFTAIVGGHDHVRASEYCRIISGVTVCQAPAKGRYVGRIDIDVKNGKARVVSTNLLPVKGRSSSRVSKLLKPYTKNLGKELDEVVGTAASTLYYRPKAGTVSSVPLVEVAAAAYRNELQTDIAFMNMGGCRKTIQKGKITKRDIAEAFPFSNKVGVFKLTGSEIEKVIAQSSAKATPERPHSFLVWSGLEYQKTGNKYKITVNGHPIDRSRVYTVATIDFVASGGDGYSIFKTKRFASSGKTEKNIITRYIKSKGVIK